MHQLYFVLVEDESEHQTMTRESAMTHAREILEEHNFAGQGGYFSSHKCDWYHIGGRWADFFSERHEWVRAATKQIEEMIALYVVKHNLPSDFRIKGTYYGRKDLQKHHSFLEERAEMIWAKNRPSDYPKVPFNRWSSTTFDVRNDDSAERLTPEVVEWLRTIPYVQECEVFDPINLEEVTVKTLLNGEGNYQPEKLKSHYLVVVDYHI